ncbi:glycosyltransferase [Acidocella sp.]|uniref:glycosyltransferase family protein n=1 Tax=Acidocella sp. TaxID=50710 RepID=UPI00263132B2|nr:glycosyltransferase [Acidocella sp.]
MKVYLVGKRRAITNWLEDTEAGLRAAGHEVRTGIFRNPSLAPTLNRLLLAEAAGAPLSRLVAADMRRFKPDIIIVVSAVKTPLEPLARLRRAAKGVPMVGWVGDVFDESHKPLSALLDLVAYTDSRFFELHAQLGLTTPAIFLPHAVSPADRLPAAAPRDPAMAFVANPTPGRLALIGAVKTPLALYGPGWSASAQAPHQVFARRYSPAEVQQLYARHAAVLNIRHEKNVLSGLNQRNFSPCLQGAAVITDWQDDLERCFEPGTEVLAYRDADGLNELYARVRAEPEFAARIGARGQARVLGEHLFGHRLERLRAELGLRAG